MTLRDDFGGDLFGHEGFDHVTDFDVAVVGDGDTALHAVGDLAGVIFEAVQRHDFAFEDDYVVAQQADFGVTLDEAVDHGAAGDGADLGDAESFADFSATLIIFFECRLKQAAHGTLDLILQLVNDGVHADVDLFLLGQFLSLAFRTHVEADDDGIGRRGQEYISFGDGADAGVDELQADFLVGKFGQQVA